MTNGLTINSLLTMIIVYLKGEKLIYDSFRSAAIVSISDVLTTSNVELNLIPSMVLSILCVQK